MKTAPVSRHIVAVRGEEEAMSAHASHSAASMIRQPVVAGRFYPGDPAALDREVAGYLAQAGPRATRPTLLAMVPHAGYVFSGSVAGRTLGAAALADTLLLLGPNHTGRGHRLALWDDGAWVVPGHEVAVDAALAQAFLQADKRLSPDVGAHLGEHSLEVVLPFLCATNPGARIVPLCVAEPNPAVLGEVATHIAAVLRALPSPVSIVVSSDMSHYVSQAMARKSDALALSRVLELDPQGLWDVVRREGISMCGVLPMALGLFVAKALGAREAVLAGYATSGEVTGDMDQVVGYAGVLVS